MSEVTPEAAQAAVTGTLGQVASVAPVSEVPDGQAMADAGARPAEVDAAALLADLQAQAAQQAAQIEQLQAKVSAAIPEPPAPAPPARTTSQISSNAPGWLHNVLNQLEDRIERLEGKGDE